MQLKNKIGATLSKIIRNDNSMCYSAIAESFTLSYGVEGGITRGIMQKWSE
jgi:hypothetical protein